MQIKVLNVDGCAKVQVVNPAADEGEQIVSEVEVQAGQEVTATVPEAHEPSEVQLGEVATTETAAEEPEGA